MNIPIRDFYDAQNAEALVQFASDAYNAAAEGREWNPPALFCNERTGIHGPVTDTHAFITEGDQDVVVAFRGTADLRNWLTDLDARMVKLVGDERIHAGFDLALESIWEKLVSALTFVDKRRLWFTGHSLGGALAVLAAERFGIGVDGVYTFGQPRVGNAAFRDHYDSNLKDRTFRVVNAVDLVPHVPWLCGRYRHCGHEIFYSGNASGGLEAFGGTPNAAGGTPALPRIDRSLSEYALGDLFAMLSEWITPTRAEQWLADHHVSNYQKLFSQGTAGTAATLGTGINTEGIGGAGANAADPVVFPKS